jgi:hypothetical protein
MANLITLGLVDDAVLTPYFTSPRHRVLPLTRNAVEAACALPDAPETIVASLRSGDEIPEGIKGSVAQLPLPQFAALDGEAGITWERITSYAVIKCADVLADRR